MSIEFLVRIFTEKIVSMSNNEAATSYNIVLI